MVCVPRSMPGVMAAPAVVCGKRALPAVCMLGLVSVPHRHRNPRWPLADCPQELGLAQISGWQDAGYLVGGQDLPGEILTPLYQISGSLSQTLSDIWLPCQISDGPPHTGTDIRRQAGPRYLHGQHSLPDIWKGGRDLKLDILTPLCQISAS